MDNNNIIYMLLLIMLISLFSKSNSYINNLLINNIKPKKLREHLNIQLNKDFTHLSYVKSKNIMHKELNSIDVYGDNTLAKNVEHIFPQYLYKNDNNKNIMRADLHNLYLCNSKINCYRQNFKYINHEDYIKHSNDYFIDQKGENISVEDIFKKQGYMMIINKKNKTFIPTHYSLGMISRSLAYFSIKYNYVEQLKNVIDIETMIQWNLKDPVSNEEYYKNIICYKYQNNYNPFIIEPELMIYSFSDMFTYHENFLLKQKISTIDPLYTIDKLLDKIKTNEEQIKIKDREQKKILKKV